MKQPLEGIRVLECGMYHAGPGGTAILADMGAEVIKVEPPGTGDPIRTSRRIGSISFEIAGNRNVFNEGANRNKKSVTVNLKTKEGQEIVHRLARQSDVFMSNMRHNVIQKLNLDYATLRELNPRLIYATVSAFGHKGPDKDRGGFDYQGQARSGFMYSMGEADTPPTASQFGIIDQATALNTCQQITTALLMRERFGMGQEIKISIMGTAMYLLYFNVLIAQMQGIEVPRHKRASEHPLRNYYQCGDGRWLMMTLTPPERHWGPLCKALDRIDLQNDPRFDTDDKRLDRAEELVAILDKAFSARPRDEWLDIFGKYDLFCCSINSLMELKDDPQVLENDYLVDLDHPTLGKIKVPGYPADFSESWIKTTAAAPELGGHTEEVLLGIGGYSKEEVGKLKKDQII